MIYLSLEVGTAMDAQITVTLPEDVLQRAELLAERIGKPVADVLADTIELAMRPLGESTADFDQIP
jgi:predicted DNA-binding protein